MYSPDFVWTLAGFILTLLILSYLIGDNPLFRLASYVFGGAAAGYVAVIIIYQVLLPRLIRPLQEGVMRENGVALVALILSALMLTKLSRHLSHLGTIPMAYLVGVGAAVVVGGAVLGTITRQVQATVNVLGFQPDAALGSSQYIPLLEGFIVLVGTVSSLVYFHFGASSQPNQPPQRPKMVGWIASIGQIFIAITLGALFAGVYATAITALVDRLDYLANTIRMLATLF